MVQDLYQVLRTHPSTREAIREHTPFTLWSGFLGDGPIELTPNRLVNYPAGALLYFPPDVQSTRILFVASGGRVAPVIADGVDSITQGFAAFCAGYLRVFGTVPTRTRLKSYLVLQNPKTWPMLEASTDKEAVHKFCRHPKANTLPDEFWERAHHGGPWSPAGQIQFFLEHGRIPLSQDEVTYNTLSQVHLPRFGLTLPYGSPVRLQTGNALVCTSEGVALTLVDNPDLWLAYESVDLVSAKARLQLRDSTPYTSTKIQGAEQFADRLRTIRALLVHNSCSIVQSYENTTGRVLNAALYQQIVQSLPGVPRRSWFLDIGTNTLVSARSSPTGETHALPLTPSPERLAAILFAEGLPTLARACQINDMFGEKSARGADETEAPSPRDKTFGDSR